jgi:hypothetical protein
VGSGLRVTTVSDQLIYFSFHGVRRGTDGYKKEQKHFVFPIKLCWLNKKRKEFNEI